MQLVVIAGGFGKRLRPLTLTRPKALIPLVDRPLVLHILDSLPPSCDEAIIAVNYLSEQVRDFFREHESRLEGWWSDAGTLANYLNAQHLLLAAGRAKIASEADVTAGSLRPPVYVGAGSFVEGRLGPDVVLGKSCKVGRASVVNATLLEGVSVDDKVEIASSIIGAGAAIGEGAHVRDSILEDGVQVPPHAEVLDDRVAA